MSKKVFVVSSSQRKRGNSDVLAEEFARGAREAGNEVTKISIRDMDLKFCTGCLSCVKTAKCILNDGMSAIYDAVQNADVLVFATPVYYYAVCGQLKTFIDRLNPLYVRKNRFKKVYLLATSAENDKSAMEGCIKDVQGFIDCYDGAELAGVVYGTGVDAAGEILNTSAPQEAYNAGKTV